MRDRIKPQVRDLKLRGLARRRSPLHRAQSQQQLIEGKRLGHVIVGAQIQAVDDVGDRIFGGQHENRAWSFFLVRICSASSKPLIFGSITSRITTSNSCSEA